ncbi:hypothetical protein BN1221_00995c [Brenneria goodwinii]|uniref:Uncharacterized protein n=1 Tax=Brenneria goodwinii TaxID=1109412 RepID=A0A0G4JRN8_9GAMM|nr:hypothetical protein BN1221_00995c [Brenneria goodwinii]
MFSVILTERRFCACHYVKTIRYKASSDQEIKFNVLGCFYFFIKREIL